MLSSNFFLLFAVCFLSFASFVCPGYALDNSLRDNLSRGQSLKNGYIFANANLELSDLPSGFEPAPAFLQDFFDEGVKPFKPRLEKEGVIIDDINSFVNFPQTTVVIALNSSLTNTQSLKRFDNQLNRPEMLTQFREGLQESIQSFGQIKIVELQNLSLDRTIGQAARRVKLKAQFQNLPFNLFVEAIAFRRDRNIIFLMAGALNQPPRIIELQTLAAQLDQRL